MDYQDINRGDDRPLDRRRLGVGRPVTHEVFTAAVSGDWDVKLTPAKMVPHSWFGDLKGKRVLGLASGGGMRCTFRRISPCAQ